MRDLNSSRRGFLLASGIAATAGIFPSLGALAAEGRAGVAEDAFIWGVPLVLTGRYLDILAKEGLPLNRFFGSPNLATPETKALGAQVDTLYGFAWLDLASAPQVIEVPDTDDRYYCIQLLDAYGNSFDYIGRRVTGTHKGAFAITPPGFAGKIPAGVTEIKAPTPTVLAFVRTLVRGTSDLPAARKIHFSYSLGTLADYPAKRHSATARAESLNVFPVIDLSSSGAAYFDELNKLLVANPPLAEDAAQVARFAAVGVGAGRKVPNDPALRDLLARAVPAGLARIRPLALDGSTWSVNGWTTRLNVTNVIHDPVRRAATHLFGPGTQVAEEALYFGARRGPDGKPLSGVNRYRLRFPPGQTPPVDAFWSVGLYTKDSYLFDNPIDRYSITDRTEGLRRAADGTLDILIQHDRPAEGASNWLPAPSDEFAITIRTYQPQRSILDKSYRLPPLELI